MESSSYINQLNDLEQISSEPWPNDATLYQPYEAEQILLPEQASCLAVKTYLKMCHLPVDVRLCANAEFMSPGGRMTKLPFLRAGAYIVSEFEPIVNFVVQRGDGIGQWMDEDEKADMRTYVSLVENIFTMAELYICFVNPQVYEEVTVPRNGCVFPWPLDKIQNFKKRRNALRLLRVYQWENMTIDDVIDKVEKCCEALSVRLEENKTPYFYGDQPCELDAVAFGHLFAIITTRLPIEALALTVGKYKSLVAFCQNIEKVYLQKKMSV